MQTDAPALSGEDGVPCGSGVPAAPAVKPEELWFGVPMVLVDGGRYTIGWQFWPENKGGPSYVTVRRSALGTLKVVERYPLTDGGWAQAWKALTSLGAATAEKVLPVLAQRRAADSRFRAQKELDARSLAFLPEVIFAGGYFPQAPLAPGQVYA